MQHDGVGPKSRQRGGEARIVEMKAGALELRRLGQEFVGIAAGEIGRPGDRGPHLGVVGLVEPDAGGEEDV